MAASVNLFDLVLYSQGSDVCRVISIKTSNNDEIFDIYRYPVGVNVIAAVDVINWNKFHSRMVVWQNVGVSILGSVALQLRNFTLLVSTDQLQSLWRENSNFDY
jgi:hypothetical protein